MSASAETPASGGHDPAARGLQNRLRFLAELFSDTTDRFSDNEGYRLAAAFSYYATFSIFPLLLLAVTIVGFVVGESDSAREQLVHAIAAPHTPVGDVLDKTLVAMQRSQSGRGLSLTVAIFTLLFGASAAFVELDDGLNRIWGIPKRKAEGLLGSVRLFLIERLSGFAIVLALGLTLVATLVSSTFLTYLADRAQEKISTPLWPALVRAGGLALGVALLSFVFVLAFHFIPRSRPPMRPLVGGAVLTAAFLTELRELFALYLAHLTRYSAYGVVGGVLALTTWIYLSSLIIYFGAQLTQVHVEKLDAAPRRADGGADDVR